MMNMLAKDMNNLVKIRLRYAQIECFGLNNKDRGFPWQKHSLGTKKNEYKTEWSLDFM